jgi:hypothetical protein
MCAHRKAKAEIMRAETLKWKSPILDDVIIFSKRTISLESASARLKNDLEAENSKRS